MCYRESWKVSKFCHMKPEHWWHQKLHNIKSTELSLTFLGWIMKISTRWLCMSLLTRMLATLVLDFGLLYGETIDVIYIFLYYEVFSLVNIFKWIWLEANVSRKVFPFLMLYINSTTVSFLINEINLNAWKKQKFSLVDDCK